MARLRPHAIAAGFVSALAVAAPATARAFCRTTSVPINDPSYSPINGQCWSQGIPLWWRNACVGYDLQKDASRQIAYDDASNIIAHAFTRWTSAACPTQGTGPSRASIDVRDLGPVNCGNVYHNRDTPNQNVIVFRDTHWPHNDPNNTLALTTVSFDRVTGELLGADMEINTAEHHIDISATPPPEAYDFESIVTHETGHFLGMAHSGDSQATMFAQYLSGTSVIRTLGTDDVAGICTAYPASGYRAVDKSVAASGFVPEGACDPTPQGGFTTECVVPAQSASCAVLGRAGARSGRGAAGVVGLLAAGAAAARRRRKPVLGWRP